MKASDRINAFIELGKRIKSLSTAQREEIIGSACSHNPWFTPANVSLSLDGVIRILEEGDLRQWSSRYELASSPTGTIGVVMAGNIPLVGFHDYLSVLVSGFQLKAKISSQDPVLLPWLHGMLTGIEPSFQSKVLFADRMDQIDAVIATGSDNTARYFEYYFRKIPHIIRKNRSSLAVLTGKESSSELHSLGNDVFSHFGLGCRNVSKVMIPEYYDFASLFPSWSDYEWVMNHHKYANNYDYQKSLFLINRIAHLDTGFILVKEDVNFVSPISVLYYERYANIEQVAERIKANVDKIQCVVSASEEIGGRIPFGEAQFPSVDDYADNIDTVAFLLDIKKVSIS